MNNKTYSFLKKANLATMIFYIILSVMTAVMGVGAIIMGLNLDYISDQLWNGQESVANGYDAFSRLLGVGLSMLIAMILLVVGIVMLVMFVFGISMVISGIRCNRAFKVPGILDVRKIRNSSIYKLVINSLFLLGSIILCVGNPSVFGGLCVTMFLCFEVLSILMLVQLSANFHGE